MSFFSKKQYTIPKISNTDKIMIALTYPDLKLNIDNYVRLGIAMSGLIGRNKDYTEIYNEHRNSFLYLSTTFGQGPLEECFRKLQTIYEDWINESEKSIPAIQNDLWLIFAEHVLTKQSRSKEVSNGTNIGY